MIMYLLKSQAQRTNSYCCFLRLLKLSNSNQTLDITLNPPVPNPETLGCESKVIDPKHRECLGSTVG